tara:strand:+ start:41002 stop:41193 length:192 start_codon:yes stop_codon:yes gene_type:complete
MGPCVARARHGVRSGPARRVALGTWFPCVPSGKRKCRHDNAPDSNLARYSGFTGCRYFFLRGQ